MVELWFRVCPKAIDYIEDFCGGKTGDMKQFYLNQESSMSFSFLYMLPTNQTNILKSLLYVPKCQRGHSLVELPTMT